MHYIVPADPTSGTPFKLSSLRARAKRRGYWITRDRHADTWSLIDADLKRPLVGLQNINLIDIARAIFALPANGNTTKHKGRGGPR
jgi:hypothetical protein